MPVSTHNACFQQGYDGASQMFGNISKFVTLLFPSGFIVSDPVGVKSSAVCEHFVIEENMRHTRREMFPFKESFAGPGKNGRLRVSCA